MLKVFFPRISPAWQRAMPGYCKNTKIDAKIIKDVSAIFGKPSDVAHGY